MSIACYPNVHVLSDPEDKLYEINYKLPVQRGSGLVVSSFMTSSSDDFEEELRWGVSDLRREGRSVFVSFMDFGRSPMLRLAGNFGNMGVEFFDYLSGGDLLDFQKSEVLGLLKRIFRS